MNLYEKLAMILVPALGLTGIMYFFDNYNVSIEQEKYHSQSKNNSKSLINISNNRISPAYISKPSSKANNEPNYIQSDSRKIILIKPKESKTRYVQRQQPQDNNFADAETLFQQDLLRQKLEKQRYQSRLKANKQKIQKRKYLTQIEERTKESRCAYYQQMKDQIRNRMNRKYTAQQFNVLENKRNYWRKKYSNHCF